MKRGVQIFFRDCYSSNNQNLPNRERPSFWKGKSECFHSLQVSFSSFADTTIVYDAKHGYENQERHYLNHYPVYKITEGTEASSFVHILEYIASRNFSVGTIIYIVENDYMHRPGAAQALFEALSIPGVEYATLYDHNDKYLYYPDLTSKIFVTSSCHWRTIPSTTNTFATKIETLMRDLQTHISFSENRDVSDDNAKWLALNKTLVSPMPGYSTHCQQGLVSPIIDWSKI